VSIVFNRSRIATAVSLALSATVRAQTPPDEPKTLPKISVEAADVEVTPKVDRVASEKFTQPLLDTPQTITIVSNEVLSQQGATTLSQALRNTPGVTFLLGENGNTSTGDSIFMRGFDTQGSIFIDGIRDLGAVSRDVFNTQQVEIAKGPAGPDYGRSAASGYVNLSSKVPTLDDAMSGTASYGTARNGRITGDLNHAFQGSGTALRLNVMGQDGDVDGRDFVARKSWAVAPSLALGLDGDTRAYFYALHTRQDNVPDGGVPTLGIEGFYNAAFDTGGANAGVVPARVDRENFYGFASDFEDIEGTMFTARFEHDFNDRVSIRNTSRFGKLRQFYVLTGVNALAVTDPVPANWTVARTRQARRQENRLLTNQTNVTADFAAGGLQHALTAGLEFIDEEQYSPSYAGLGTAPPANVYRPDRRDALPDYAPVRDGRFTRGETRTAGLYAFDTLTFDERWEATAGVRVDSFETDFDSAVLSTATSHPTLPEGTLVPAPAQVDDTLFSYKVGVVFKPAENGSIYLSHAISQQPPGGANLTFSGNANNVNNPDLDPTEGRNLELGTKWELRGGALAVTGAVYHSESRNELTPDPVDPTIFLQLGKRTVEGVELGLVGKLGDDWEVSAGLAKMKTEVERGLAHQDGLQITWSPELTFTSWTTYHAPFGLSVGGGLRYVDSVVRPVTSNPSNTPPPPDQTNMRTAPDYWVVDMMASYEISERVSLQLNVYNLTDEFYVATLNNSGARYSPGAPRSGLLTLNFSY
jgi:catecholate siderophore receptor